MTATLSPEQEIRFQELSQATYSKVFNLAYRLSGDRADAEDLTQEAFYRAYRGFDGFEGDRPFENWIFRILTRLFLDMKRARSRRVQTVSSDAPIRAEGRDDTVQFEVADARPGPEDELMKGIVSPELEKSLLKLSEDQRRLVWLADVEGVPYAEIATMMDTPVGTVRSRLHRAHKQLRAMIEKMKSQPGEPCLAC
ncbi:MAG: sigma-70 family RNA polymerase sigma factor [Fimbriimonadaceae bacterium]|jgi:RNA polymerase sigma-70 factor (ECF subfamily)|nr:sigma-70 family RNA polymerase sigma factor [Fimbriimonadaceae bacterium]